ncbi:MAG TPA: YhdP family protein, partial [Burkholderiaceae bacterium]|nr:YhdP family protein [Burkholderiaceae bacterium]
FFPGVFEDPEVTANRLDARVHWRTAPTLEIGVDAFAFSNDDLEVSATGTYRPADPDGAWADMNASLARANAATVYRYVPLGAGTGARSWLRAALREGRLSAGELKLRGKLDAFPFATRDSGQFEASLHLAGVTLDYAPSTPQHPRTRPWPLMTGMEADLNVKGDQIDIVGGQAAVYGVNLTKVSGRISQLSTQDPHLAISGQGNGQLADLVGYVNASPVSQMVGGFLDGTKATGPGRLQIKLDIPLNHSLDTEVDGSVFFQGNDVALRADLTPLSAVSGRLDFNQHGIRIPGINAGFAGGQARIEADTKDGALTFQVTGSATPQGLRRQFDSALVRRVLDNAHGLARYATALTMRGTSLEVHASSDLTGLAIDLPEPLGKPASDALPLRVDVVPNLAASPMRDSLHVTAGSLLEIQLERVADPAPDGVMHIDRGVISIGSPGALPETGLLVHLTLPRLDTDRWLPLLEAAPDESAAGAVTPTVPDLVAAHIDELWISGKRLNNVVMGASRAADGGWNANIEADQTSGSMHWQSGTRGTPGKLTARLARLIIPEGAREGVTEVLDAPVRELPELDVVAQDFVLGSSHLGHLELSAQNSRSGRSNTWQLKRLQIDNPDGHIAGSGQWQREPGSQKRRMTLSITLDVVDAGNLLGRFGLAGAIRKGSSKLTGNLSWLGSPFAIDYPTLSGDLQLSAEKGQFLKVEPGTGRLLGVMSLQSLPRRVSLDFRDIFSKGFAFDTIKATAHISNGVLRTSDFTMIGAAASVLIDGETNLQTESQNLHVRVLPEIDASSASVLYAFIANPAIGIGTLLAQWALRHPLAKIFSYEYDITGSWAEPLVKRHERAKPETPEEKTG